MEPKEPVQPATEGKAMPSMMREMMSGMMSGTKDFNPAAMCQAMMTSVGKSAEMAAYATPEVRTLFEEWARSVEEEVWAALKARGPVDLATLAAALKIGPDSLLYFVGKLVREGKATIDSIRATVR